jgi:hypothetical protein
MTTINPDGVSLAACRNPFRMPQHRGPKEATHHALDSPVAIWDFFSKLPSRCSPETGRPGRRPSSPLWATSRQSMYSFH